MSDRELISAFALAYLLRILHSQDPELTANLSFDGIQRALPAMKEVGFDADLVSRLSTST